jgi:hypothetical protein
LHFQINSTTEDLLYSFIKKFRLSFASHHINLAFVDIVKVYFPYRIKLWKNNIRHVWVAVWGRENSHITPGIVIVKSVVICGLQEILVTLTFHVHGLYPCTWKQLLIMHNEIVVSIAVQMVNSEIAVQINENEQFIQLRIYCKFILYNIYQ